MIDNYYVIDAHCHVYPQKIAKLATSHTDNFYGVVSYNEGTIDDLLEKGDDAGVDHFIIQSVATTPHQVKSINEFIAKNVSILPKKLTGLGTVHPRSEDMQGDLEHLKELGLKGVKIHPDIQGFKVDDDGYKKMFKFCEQNNLTVLIHTGDYRYDNSNPNRLVPLLKEFENLTVVGAHFGGWSIYEKACKELKNFKNFYVDCSSSFYYIDKKVAKNIILDYGVDKVLFATDYPMWDIKKEIETLLSLGLDKEDYEKIFSQNAKKVYSIKTE